MRIILLTLAVLGSALVIAMFGVALTACTLSPDLNEGDETQEKGA